MRDRVWTILEVLLVVVVLALVVGQLLGQPVLLGYVTSGSMTPAIKEGDGFVAIPAALAGEVDVGDVVVFRAEEIEAGRLTTHRVIRETDAGFVTKGDANPVTDQADGEPPVLDQQIVAVAWQVDGAPVTIPALGTIVVTVQDTVGRLQGLVTDVVDLRAVLGTRWLAYVLFGLTVLLYLVDRRLSAGRRRTRETARDTGSRTWLLVGMMTLAIVLAASLVMVVPSGPHEHDFVSSNHDTEGASVIGVGETETTTLFVRNGGLAPIAVFVEPATPNVDVQPRSVTVGGGGTESLTLTITAPDETGAFRYFISEHRYLAILPQAHLRALHDLHPWLPILAIDAMIAIPFYVLGVGLVGRGRLRRRSRDGPGHVRRLTARIRQ
jgi:signal peptidase